MSTKLRLIREIKQLEVDAKSVNEEEERESEGLTLKDRWEGVDVVYPEKLKEIEAIKPFGDVLLKLDNPPFSEDVRFDFLHNVLNGNKVTDVKEVLMNVCACESKLQTVISQTQVERLKKFLDIKRGVDHKIKYVDRELMRSDLKVGEFLKSVDEMFKDTKGRFRSTERVVESISSTSTKMKVTKQRATNREIRNSYQVIATHNAPQPLESDTMYVYVYKGMNKGVLLIVPKTRADNLEEKIEIQELSHTWKYILREAKKAHPKRKNVKGLISPLSYDEWLKQHSDDVKVMTQMTHGLNYIQLEKNFNLCF